MTEEQFQELKGKVERAKVDAERAQGALEELKTRLKREFEVSSFAAAKALQKDMEKRATKLDTELDKMVKDYEEQWHGSE